MSTVIKSRQIASSLQYMKRKVIPTTIAFQLLLALLFAACSQKKPKVDAPSAVKVALREVGNELLLANEDSTSLVLPVVELPNNTYKLSFESSLLFAPGKLTTTITDVFSKANLPKSYLVEVFQCVDGEVAYSYEMKQETTNNLVPCSSRVLPYGCYYIQVSFIKLNPSLSGNQFLFYVLVFLVLSFLIFVFYSRFITRNNDEIDDTGTSLGSFSFYPEQHKLVKAAKEISLTQKECELLAILVASPNQIVTREELTKKVWEDNGVVVGRSLDTYISKLRKKLQEDQSIQITNVHGVGYKLDM